MIGSKKRKIEIQKPGLPRLGRGNEGEADDEMFGRGGSVN
jgi:hypothetical protein